MPVTVLFYCDSWILCILKLMLGIVYCWFVDCLAVGDMNFFSKNKTGFNAMEVKMAV